MTERKRLIHRAVRVLGAALCLLGTVAATADDAKARRLIEKKCGACHLEQGKLSRIPEMRKSPEGWDMSVIRMGIWHKVEVSPDERRAIVKYLADTQGLAPSESAPFRFLIERVPNMQDTPPDEELAQMCGRCHSYGRVALQRRDEGEWRKLAHTHLGQFPSAEYSALGRDRNWWEIARDVIPAKLAKLYPKDTPAWREWRRSSHRPVAGQWVVAGERPGWGRYTGKMSARAKGGDRYDVRYDLHYEAGNTVSGVGEALIYTGYEWRGSARLGNEDTRSIFALSADGARLTGRWFLKGADEIGASFAAVRADKATKNALVAISPPLVRAGETTVVTLTGAGLASRVDLGAGVDIVDWLHKSPTELRLRVRVAADAAVGPRQVAVGGVPSAPGFAVYRQFDSVRVEPEFAIARLGGGTVAMETAQFAAIAFLNGPDDKPGTADDIRLGNVPATWSTEPFDERARADDDPRYAGHMAPHGQFVPSFAGPNPARHNLNNVGNLAVVATVKDGDQALNARSHLMVSVQRWNKPPLR